MVAMYPRARRPLAPITIGFFFAIATVITIAAGVSLLMPGSILDAMWRIKAEEHQQLLQIALPASMGFFVLAVVMAAASMGSFLRRRWAWRLAIVIFIVNGLGDGVRILSDAPMEVYSE